MCEERFCKKCGRRFVVALGSPERLCYGCWSNEPAERPDDSKRTVDAAVE